MKRKLVALTISVSLLFALGINQAFAHCGMCGMEQKAGEEKAVVSQTETFQAKVICLGCTLKKEKAAKAQCSIYGHKNALRTEDGRIWTILENDVSAELINSHDYAGKKVEIKGKKYKGAQVIEIATLKLLEE